MLRLEPVPGPQISLASAVCHLIRAVRRLVIDALRLGATLGLLYLVAVALGVFR